MENKPIKKRYYFITGIVFLLGIILLFLPFKQNYRELAPENLLLSISNEDRFFDTDEVARLIISEDPSIMLIDVRPSHAFKAYRLPGAINIPLSSILDKDEKGYIIWEAYLNDENKTTIFYSNGSVYANQAWMLTKRMNFKNNYVMKGGLNKFFESIIMAKKPLDSAPESEQQTYQFRKAAAMYFGGGSTEINTISDTKTNQKLPPKKKKKEVEESGGC
jgi:rhodanese-related sulfurtransferase